MMVVYRYGSRTIDFIFWSKANYIVIRCMYSMKLLATKVGDSLEIYLVDLGCETETA
jgi:hypothetical protein